MWDKTTQLQSKAELKFVTVDLLDHLQMHNHVFCNTEIALDILDLVLRHTLKTAQKNYLVAGHACGSWACWESRSGSRETPSTRCLVGKPAGRPERPFPTLTEKMQDTGVLSITTKKAGWIWCLRQHDEETS